MGVVRRSEEPGWQDFEAENEQCPERRHKTRTFHRQQFGSAR